MHLVQQKREEFLCVLLPVLGAGEAAEVLEDVPEDPVRGQDGRGAEGPGRAQQGRGGRGNGGGVTEAGRKRGSRNGERMGGVLSCALRAMRYTAARLSAISATLASAGATPRS